MTLNLQGMLKAPIVCDWEVTMRRCKSLNATQNERQKRITVSAASELDAKAKARFKNPEFFPVSARKKPL